MPPSMIKLLSYADIVSLVNALLGSLSILILYYNQYGLAFSLLMIALLTDGIDGIVARKTKKSTLGTYFEAMADMVSLGVAPMAFVFYTYLHTLTPNGLLFLGFFLIAFLFLVCSCIRLASFHQLTTDQYFIGLPVSAGMIFLVVFSYLQISILVVLLVAVLVSLGMISQIRFPKMNLQMNGVAAVLIIVTIIMGTRFNGVAPLLLVSALTMYVVGGSIRLEVQEKKKNKK